MPCGPQRVKGKIQDHVKMWGHFCHATFDIGIDQIEGKTCYILVKSRVTRVLHIRPIPKMAKNPRGFKWSETKGGGLNDP